MVYESSKLCKPQNSDSSNLVFPNRKKLRRTGCEPEENMQLCFTDDDQHRKLLAKDATGMEIYKQIVQAAKATFQQYGVPKQKDTLKKWLSARKASDPVIGNRQLMLQW